MPIEIMDDPGDALVSDPLADLLFTLIAAVLPAILLLAPLTETTRNQVQAHDAARRASERSARALPEAASAPPVVAGNDGLDIGGPRGRHVDLDRISDDPVLAAYLDELRGTGKGLSVIVEPNGLEGAFLLDPVVAAHGLTDYDELRLTTACADAPERALRELCGPKP